MNRQRWILLSVSLVLIAATAGFLLRLKASQKLGQPGLKLKQVPGGNEVQIDLPEQVGSYVSDPAEITEGELAALPKDTTFGRRIYRSPGQSTTLVSVVLMGTDRTSIHKPQFCLRGQGWTIDRSELTTVPMSRPRAYELPVMKLTTSRTVSAANGETWVLRGIYVYWFVAENHLTGQHAKRMWWMARDLIEKGVLQRWAYVTVFSECAPGEEEKLFDRMKEFIALSVPEFQLTTGQEKPIQGPVTAALR